jgi:hypothetical protein
LANDFLGDKEDKDEMGGACSMHGREQKFLQDIGAEICRKETT